MLLYSYFPKGEVHPLDALLSSPIQVKGTSRNKVNHLLLLLWYPGFS